MMVPLGNWSYFILYNVKPPCHQRDQYTLFSIQSPVGTLIVPGPRSLLPPSPAPGPQSQAQLAPCNQWLKSPSMGLFSLSYLLFFQFLEGNLSICRIFFILFLVYLHQNSTGNYYLSTENKILVKFNSVDLARFEPALRWRIWVHFLSGNSSVYCFLKVILIKHIPTYTRALACIQH